MGRDFVKSVCGFTIVVDVPIVPGLGFGGDFDKLKATFRPVLMWVFCGDLRKKRMDVREYAALACVKMVGVPWG